MLTHSFNGGPGKASAQGDGLTDEGTAFWPWVSARCEVFMVVSGHVASATRVFVNECGRDVLGLGVDYQHENHVLLDGVGCAEQAWNAGKGCGDGWWRGLWFRGAEVGWQTRSTLVPGLFPEAKPARLTNHDGDFAFDPPWWEYTPDGVN